jgi:hypothetical protein
LKATQVIRPELTAIQAAAAVHLPQLRATPAQMEFPRLLTGRQLRAAAAAAVVTIQALDTPAVQAAAVQVHPVQMLPREHLTLAAAAAVPVTVVVQLEMVVLADREL